MLEISQLAKSYGDVVALTDATFAVEPGRLVGFVGPNGAGKSTTMRSIFGLVAPDSGLVTWNGEPAEQVDRSQFGYLPEQRGLYPKMKIGEQVSYFAQLKGIPRGEAKTRATTILEMLDLGDRVSDPLEALSHGNQQRVQLAVALVHDPGLLILDEPFNGLDPVAVEVLRDVLRQRAIDGAAVLFSSHQLDLVEQLCDDVVVIARGVVQATGTVRDVRRSTGTQQAVVEIEHPETDVSDAFAQLTVLDITHAEGRATARLELQSTSELGAVVAGARNCGQLVSLNYQPPSLTDIFKELVR